MLAFLRQRKWVVVGVVAVVLAYAGGRWGTPPRVVTRESTEASEKLRVQIQSLETKISSYQKAMDDHLTSLARETDRKHVRVETRPDGTKIVDRTEDVVKTDRKTEDKHATASGTASTEKHIVATTAADRTLRTSSERIEILPTLGLPRLLVGVGVGTSVPGLLGGTPDRQLLPFVPHAVMGTLSLDFRLFGSNYVGVWGTTSGAVGLGVRVGVR